MRILYVTTTFPPKSFGGVTTVSYKVARMMSGRGHQVTVFTTDLEDRSARTPRPRELVEMSGLSVHYFANASNRLANAGFFSPMMMIRAIRRHILDFDLIHVHDLRSLPSVAVHHYALMHKVPYVLQAHGSAATFFQKGLLKSAYDRMWGQSLLADAGRLIATTPAEAQQLIGMGAREERVAVVPNGIDVSEFANPPPRGSLRQKLGIPDSHRIVLFLGRLNRVKGADLLVDAFAQLSRDHQDVDLIIAGPDDGDLGTISKMIDDLRLRDRAWCVGTLTGKDKLAAYVDADIFVLPSRYEIFGLVTFESIMCGTPVVVTDACGTASMVRDAGMGYVAKAGDTASLCDMIARALSDPSEGSDQVERGQRYVMDNLALDIVVTQLESLYGELLPPEGAVRAGHAQPDSPMES